MNVKNIETEINNKGNVNCLENTPFGIQYDYFIKFFIGLKIFFWYGIR